MTHLSRLRPILASALALASSLTLVGCDEEPVICTAVLVTSVRITVVDAVTGDFVPDAVVAFRVDGGELRMPVEDFGDGATWADLAYEEAGVFDVSIEADGYETAQEQYVVEPDGCHVDGVADTVELVPVPQAEG